MITLHDAAKWVGIEIEYMDAVIEANLQASLDAALARIGGSVGKDVETYLPGDARVEMLLRIYTEEAYDNHQGSAKQDSAKNYLRSQLELQLQLELRVAKEAAGGGGS